MKRKTQKSKASGKGRISGWIAAGALAAHVGMGESQGLLLHAQQPPGQIQQQVPTPSLQLPPSRFDLAAGSLDSALVAFQEITAIKVVLHLPPGTLEGLLTPGVSGDMTPDVALQRLLENTGLACRFLDRTTAVIEVAKAVTNVDVTANVMQLAIPTYTEPILDTPQTVTVVPQAIIQEQGATTLREVLRNVAGISMAAGEGGSQGDNLTIRGFTARNDIFLDDMRDFGSYYRDPFNYEQVEVLQGPSSVTFGRGSTGGVVNQVSKSPTAARLLAGGLNFGTNGLMRGTADIDSPVHLLGQGAAFRLNVMGMQTGVAGRDVAEYRRWGVAPSLVLGLGTPTRLQFSYLHEAENDTPDYGIPWLFNGPAPVDRSNYYGFKDSNYLDTDVEVGTVRLDHTASHGMTFHDQLRYAHFTRDAQITEAQIAGSVNLGTPLDRIMVNRNQIAVNSVETMLNNQLDLTGTFGTGSLRHDFVAGVEATRETSDPTRPRWTGVPQTSLLDPNELQVFAGTSVISSRVQATAVGVGVYAIDTVKFGRHWKASAGIRWDRFDTDYRQSVTPASSFSRVDEMPTYRAAIVYKPVEYGSIYVDYGTSFNPSAETLSLSAANADLPPVTNRTYEAGTKWDLRNGRTTLRVALFRTEVTNAREPDPLNPLLNVLSGVQVVDGFEAEVSGRVTRRWRVLAGYALMNSELAESVFYPQSVGSQLPNVPHQTFNAWNTFDLPWHFQIGAGGNYVGSRTASATAPLDPITGLVKQVPGYWVFNTMAKYQASERISVQVNVNNLADRYYYDQIHPVHIVPGEALNAQVGLNFSF